MGVFCGVDMVEIERVKDSIDKLGESFIQRIFTPAEIEYCENRRSGKYESYTARFAAKEAISKALGTGFTQGVGLKGIELIATESGKPEVILHGRTKERFISIGGTAIDISMTHCRDYAVAFAVIQTKD
ncbi:MAG: holo-ACP synthase [Clostridia bacterium]|nr:holo-ACP synthase [Clostridia bacterium]